MKAYHLKALLICLSLLSFTQVHAEDIGMSVQDSYRLVQDNGAKVLFIDVRDPVEIMFTGFTNAVDRNIPFLLADRYDWDTEKNRFRMNRNPYFLAEVEAALEEKGLGRDAIIITMCRSGSERGLPSAEFLRENGFRNAHYVVHGFQGSSLKEGDKQGLRIVNGWQNAGLPWQSKPDGNKIYRAKSR